MSEADPILPDDDDATVRRKVLAGLEGDSRMKMAQSLDNPKYLAAVRAAANKRPETEPHRRLVPTEIHRVIEDLRQRDPESRKRALAVWSDPAAAGELTRALANEKAHLRAQAALPDAAEDGEHPEPVAKVRWRNGVLTVLLLVVALAGIVRVVTRERQGEPTPVDVETAKTTMAHGAAAAASGATVEALSASAEPPSTTAAATIPSATAAVVPRPVASASPAVRATARSAASSPSAAPTGNPSSSASNTLLTPGVIF